MFPKLEARADLTSAMAGRAGCDLAGAMDAGQFDAAEYRAAVLRCCTCRKAEECRGHLASPATVTGAVPDYCLNKDLFGALTAAPSPPNPG